MQEHFCDREIRFQQLKKNEETSKPIESIYLNNLENKIVSTRDKDNL